VPTWDQKGYNFGNATRTEKKVDRPPLEPKKQKNIYGPNPKPKFYKEPKPPAKSKTYTDSRPHAYEKVLAQPSGAKHPYGPDFVPSQLYGVRKTA